MSEYKAHIKDINGNVILDKVVDAPSDWSDTAKNIVVAKYLHELDGDSIFNIIKRLKHGIWDFTNDQELADRIYDLVLNQHMAFNSPVWFNLGIEAKPQCSACFIISVGDSMDSILDLCKTEGMLFKGGSGTGTNLSGLRASNEPLRCGGVASGPVSFMRGFDSFAGVIKSGGKTRRAAKMVVLDVDHPDIEEFVKCKAIEEFKARALISGGFSAAFNEPGGAYDTLQYQNANHSVRVTDEFMKRAMNGGSSKLTSRVTDSEVSIDANELLMAIAKAAHECGDPGIQFADTINWWHTCKEDGDILASNPCSEYVFLDDTSCNLASLNLRKFQTNSEDYIDVDKFREAISDTITAMDSFVDNASYPTEVIAEQTKKYRTLGLGYANLGALLMSLGIPYDSEEGRDIAAAITAVMTGQAYLRSIEMARRHGPFDGWQNNRDVMQKVMESHLSAVEGNQPISSKKSVLWETALQIWKEVVEKGKYGFRNAQVTVLAPTGTIGLVMDCDTTGIEPELALVKHKKLEGGGDIKIVNQSAAQGLRALGYGDYEINEVKLTGRIGSHIVKEEHLPAFACSLTEDNMIPPMAHVKMMAAVQPFLSGAISKTVNLAHDASVEDIYDIYTKAFCLGLKSIAVYRDGSKASQPLTTEAGVFDGSLESCSYCGAKTVPSGTCTKCMVCGTTVGCS